MWRLGLPKQKSLRAVPFHHRPSEALPTPIPSPVCTGWPGSLPVPEQTVLWNTPLVWAVATGLEPITPDKYCNVRQKKLFLNPDNPQNLSDFPALSAHKCRDRPMWRSKRPPEPKVWESNEIHKEEGMQES